MPEKQHAEKGSQEHKKQHQDVAEGHQHDQTPTAERTRGATHRRRRPGSQGSH